MKDATEIVVVLDRSGSMSNEVNDEFIIVNKLENLLKKDLNKKVKK